MKNYPIDILKRYGLFGTIRLIVDLLNTFIFYRKARLIRRPTYIRGKRNIRWGTGFTTGVGIRLDAFTESDEVLIHIGDGVEVNDYVHIAAIKSVQIGDDSLIASKVFISDHHHGEYRKNDPLSSPLTPPARRPLIAKPVYIGKRVWIGEGVCILPGVTIGDGAVIGAGSIVTHDIPPATVVVGNPACIIRQYNVESRTWAKH